MLDVMGACFALKYVILSIFVKDFYPFFCVFLSVFISKLRDNSPPSTKLIPG